MAGKISSATALRKNNVANATDTSWLFARIAGASAAMALPPQIAVPTVTSTEVSRPVFSKRPSASPRLMVIVMPITV